ncbi:secreted antigen 1 [Babesia divergens]|uniref:Secreted antigen 1 n=1 Tax=Babesia divergens TaxID=32595 RepID=A0AAD9GJG2_BABDI|nr:secreted antigen 1 [Babesia divergens]
MKLLGILRVTTLCFVATGFYGPSAVSCSNQEGKPSSILELPETYEGIYNSTLNEFEFNLNLDSKTSLAPQLFRKVKAHLDATGMPAEDSEELVESLISMVSHRIRDLKDNLSSHEPTSIRDVLDFLGMLGQSQIKAQVLKKLESMVQTRFDTQNVPGLNVQKNLEGLLENIQKLRKDLLQDPSDYGHFSGITEFLMTPEACVTALINWLPFLHSELFLLHFQTSPDGSLVGCGAWKDDKLRPTAGKNGLNQWLTDDVSRIIQIPKGFIKDGLSTKNTGGRISAHTGLQYYGGGPLSHAQLGLFMLRSIWDDSNLGSAVLFLEEFCREVNGIDSVFWSALRNTPHGVPGLKALCQEVSKDLKPLTGGVIYALYNPVDTKNPYNGALRSDSFGAYVDWLAKNIDEIKTSLENMTKDSYTWSLSALSEVQSAGPFKYGFVFNESDWEGNIDRKLKPVIERLTARDNSLTKLSRHMQRMKSH